jgi:hypothetical protein
MYIAQHAEQADHADGRADRHAEQPKQVQRGNQVEQSCRTGRQSRQTGRQLENADRPSTSRQRFIKTDRKQVSQAQLIFISCWNLIQVRRSVDMILVLALL